MRDSFIFRMLSALDARTRLSVAGFLAVTLFLVPALHLALTAILSPLTRGAGGVCSFCVPSTAFTPPAPPCQGETVSARPEDCHA